MIATALGVALGLIFPGHYTYIAAFGTIFSRVITALVVPIVIFLILVAVAYNKIAAKDPEKVEPFKKFIDAGNTVMGKVVSIVISYTPYAVLSLIARQVSRSSIKELLPLLSVLVLVYVLCAVQFFLVEGTLLKLIGHVSPIKFLRTYGLRL